MEYQNNMISTAQTAAKSHGEELKEMEEDESLVLSCGDDSLLPAISIADDGVKLEDAFWEVNAISKEHHATSSAKNQEEIREVDLEDGSVALSVNFPPVNSIAEEGGQLLATSGQSEEGVVGGDEQSEVGGGGHGGRFPVQAWKGRGAGRPVERLRELRPCLSVAADGEGAAQVEDGWDGRLDRAVLAIGLASVRLDLELERAAERERTTA